MRDRNQIPTESTGIDFISKLNLNIEFFLHMVIIKYHAKNDEISMETMSVEKKDVCLIERNRDWYSSMVSFLSRRNIKGMIMQDLCR